MGVVRTLAAAVLLAMTASGALAAPKLDAKTAFAQSQAAIGNQTGDLVLRDHLGNPLSLADLRGKPLVISLIYTSCATVCPLVTDHLADAVANVRKVVGDGEFNVLSFGFDASGDKPAQLDGFAGVHGLKGIDDWYVASADAGTTEALLRQLGFSYKAAAGGFQHITQVSILDAEGKVYRQVYGDDFPLPQLMEPLMDLTLGRFTRSAAPGDLWDRLTFLCTSYNPLTGAYRFDYAIFFGIFFGGLSLILSGIVVFRLWLERRRAMRARDGGSTPGNNSKDPGKGHRIA